MADSALTLKKGEGPGLELLATASASSDSTVDFDNYLDSTYDDYKLVISGYVPGTDDTECFLRAGTGSTPDYQSGSSDYWYATQVESNIGTGNAANGGSGASEIRLDSSGAGCGNDTGESFNCEIMIYNSQDDDIDTYMTFQLGNTRADGASQGGYGFGHYLSSTAVTSLQILASSGNIASGEFKLYGLKKTV